ncbi:MAG: GNAT family N-acetyltransferase [Salinigranum sp.]
MPGAFLTGDLVTLRTIEEEDLPFVRDGVNHPAVRRPIGQKLPTNLAQETREFEARNADGEGLRLLITHQDVRVGIIQLAPIDTENGTARVTYWIDPSHRRQGYARDALDAIAGYAFDELRVHKLTARVFAFNEASIELLRGAGFTEEGVHREESFVDGRYVDAHWLGLLEREWREE